MRTINRSGLLSTATSSPSRRGQQNRLTASVSLERQIPSTCRIRPFLSEWSLPAESVQCWRLRWGNVQPLKFQSASRRVWSTRRLTPTNQPPSGMKWPQARPTPRQHRAGRIPRRRWNGTPRNTMLKVREPLTRCCRYPLLTETDNSAFNKRSWWLKVASGPGVLPNLVVSLLTDVVLDSRKETVVEETVARETTQLIEVPHTEQRTRYKEVSFGAAAAPVEFQGWQGVVPK